MSRKSEMGDGCRLKVLADFAVMLLDEFGKYASRGKDGMASPAHFLSGYPSSNNGVQPEPAFML